MLSTLPDGGAHVVVMLTEELVVYMTPNSKGFVSQPLLAPLN